MIFKEKNPFLSSFQKTRLYTQLKDRVAGVKGVSVAAYCLVDGTVPDALIPRLTELLAAECLSEWPLLANTVWVSPRLGTRSTWCSKATDIARQCGVFVLGIERILVYTLECEQPLTEMHWNVLQPLLHDRMTQSLHPKPESLEQLFQHADPQPDGAIPLLKKGLPALQKANEQLGLALSSEEMDYLVMSAEAMQRDPTAAELMMFAQANSEHCRHKVFNAEWSIDNTVQAHSLFAKIKQTYQHSSKGVLSAYKDNAAVLAGSAVEHYFVGQDQQYRSVKEPLHTVLKVETHNHPTGISPYSGAATGVGGEIRDEAATGRGAYSIAGLTGFCVSHLKIPDWPQPWEQANLAPPDHMASALEIMLAAPQGAAAFGNEFGRPNLLGYFRTFYHPRTNNEAYGYHKPILLAGGLGRIRGLHVNKETTQPGALVVVLGGPAMLIGLGGGAASSMTAATGKEQLDYASVQRGNPEMQRRCQEVINQCWALGKDNPILAIHDVGAGGLANAVPEILHDSECGGELQLRAIPQDERSLTPMALWCNESQERYVLTLLPERLSQLEKIAARERCPLAVLGKATKTPHLNVHDVHFQDKAVAVPMSWLFAHPPKMQRQAQHSERTQTKLDRSAMDFSQALTRILQFPAVASKQFLITLADRSVTGLVSRDPMVGPWQVPVADLAVTLCGFNTYQGTAVALGERSPLALLDPSASVRIALGEALTNLMAAPIGSLNNVRASANWMATVNDKAEEIALWHAVDSVSSLCQHLNICIPVGKDSLSMQTTWKKSNNKFTVISPVSLNLTLSAPVIDVRAVLTPQLHLVASQLILVDLGLGQQRLGGSVLAQVYQQMGEGCPDVTANTLQHFCEAMQACHQARALLAYHDRSDGGLWATLCEMAFAGHCGLSLDLSALGEDVLAILANEELGAVLQVANDRVQEVLALFTHFNLAEHCHVLGTLNADDHIRILHNDQICVNRPRAECQQTWAETSYRLQALRDNPTCAKSEFNTLLASDNLGLHARLSFDYPLAAPNINTQVRPKVALLREQGVNGHVEMAAAFQRAGFECIDVHMQDLIDKKINLAAMQGLVACGGFSFGDVLGAGRGWASAIRYHETVREIFTDFWADSKTFTLGVCNGCQMLSYLRDLVPGGEGFPEFKHNDSEQFEARLLQVEILESPSLLFQGMAGTQLPITVAHAEGRVVWPQAHPLRSSPVMRYVDPQGRATTHYPYNPNGSEAGLTGFCSDDGRVTILMPHPERVFRTVQCAWAPAEWQEDSPWMKLFYNARAWVD